MLNVLKTRSTFAVSSLVLILWHLLEMVLSCLAWVVPMTGPWTSQMSHYLKVLRVWEWNLICHILESKHKLWQKLMIFVKVMTFLSNRYFAWALDGTGLIFYHSGIPNNAYPVLNCWEFKLLNGKGGWCLHTSQVAHWPRAYPGYCSLKQLGLFVLPPGGDASTSQGYSSVKFAGNHWDGERHSESKVSCKRSQQNVPCKGLNPHRLIRRRVH